MTTNQERAAKVIDTEHVESLRNMRLPNPSKLARALDAAGLLAPDLPEPNSTIDGEPSWEVKREDKHFEIGMYDDFSGITFDDYTTGAMISLPPADMREAAYALLAAADYAEQEQDNE